jgi:transposase
MAYREHGMWEVLEVLRRVHRGEAFRAIARATGRDRKTVARYAQTAADLGWVRGVHEPDEDLASAVLACLRPGPRDLTPSETKRLLRTHAGQVRKWLAGDDQDERGLTLTKVLTLLKRDGVELSYSSLYRYAVKHFGFGRDQTTVRVADAAPGELAEADFGRMGLVPDPETGKKRVLYALIVTLVYSRHQYVHLTHSQKLADLIDGLEEAWEFFGGVPTRVILDNLKAAVTKADRYDPTFQRTFEEYARHRGFIIDAAVAGEPKGKPHVERAVPYVRENFFRGEHFLSRDHAQREAVRWCLTTAGTRIHGTTRKQPLGVFEDVEKPCLKPIEGERFDTPTWGEPKIHPDFHIRFGNALYSVPHQYRHRKGQKTTVRGDRRLVRIYVDGKLVKTHPTQPPGGRSTDYDDYPPEKTAYAMRDANYLIRRAKEKGKHVGLFTELLLSGDFPWAKLRQAQKLLRLTDKYGSPRVDAACRRALRFDLINVNRVERIVIQALEQSGPLGRTRNVSPAQVVQLPLRFLRDDHSFNHHKPNKETDDGSESLT